ncbi:MAG: GPP34 family phosphoprotein [Mycolicibacterium sp.]|nr:GPP34 family phosphoprotein [Mycolicibacterium sp.]
MSTIAGALMQVLLDNASAQPLLDVTRRRRMLAAATLLDLALACRLRPATPEDPVPEDTLVVLAGPSLSEDPVLGPALDLLARRPLTAPAAVGRLARRTEARLLTALRDSGQVTPMRLAPSPSSPAVISGRRPRRSDRRAWLLTDRTQAAAVRAELLAVLVDGAPVRPPVAGLISVLHAGDSVRELLSLDPRAWPRVLDVSAEIAAGSWLLNRPDDNEPDDEPTLAEVNLAVTSALVCAAI